MDGFLNTFEKKKALWATPILLQTLQLVFLYVTLSNKSDIHRNQNCQKVVDESAIQKSHDLEDTQKMASLNRSVNLRHHWSVKGVGQLRFIRIILTGLNYLVVHRL